MQEENSDIETILRQYYILYMYNMFRLIIIALIITYFIGCVFYFISNELNLIEIPGKQLVTFIDAFGLLDIESDMKKLVKMCYFALTTLSTVGYGDMSPVSEVEMLTGLVIMLGGVAFFSFIMGNFIEIIESYREKMGFTDKSEELEDWIISLERYSKNSTPISKSLIDYIESNINYHWAKDRLSCFEGNSKYNHLIPKNIKI